MNPSEQIDKQIAALGDWRGEKIAHTRKLIHEAVPDIIEEWKWGTGVWSQGGMICAIGAFNDHVKINFFKGASLPDPDGLFNGGLEAKNSRSVDIKEHDRLHEDAFKTLIRTAVALNK